MFDRNNLASLEDETPFFAYSPATALANLEEYRTKFPAGTEICYAMKANSERSVLETFKEAGASFEVASKYELKLLEEIQVAPERIIYGTSVRPESHLSEFVRYGVDRYAFDSLAELEKIARHAPGARVYVRALVDDQSDSVFRMSEKFGTQPINVVELLTAAGEMGLVPYGISFNVGSQAKNPAAWARGVRELTPVIEELKEKGITIEMLNLGGGFPYSYRTDDGYPSLDEIMRPLNEALTALPYEVSILIEPGRALIANAFILVTTVIAISHRDNGTWAFTDAGVYNALFEALACQGSTYYKIEMLEPREGPTEGFIVTGPTGDNLDVLDGGALLPADLKIGDKLIIHDTGAYTFTLMTPFNGFPKPDTVIQPDIS
jgi:ornithine decarboxylase